MKGFRNVEGTLQKHDGTDGQTDDYKVPKDIYTYIYIFIVLYIYIYIYIYMAASRLFRSHKPKWGLCCIYKYMLECLYVDSSSCAR